MKFLRFLNKWFEEIVISGFMGLFVTVTVLQVIARLLKISAPWTEEIARYSFIWMTLVGSAVAVKHRQHVRVDILESIVPAKVRPFIYWISMGLFMVFALVLLVYGCDVCADLIRAPQKTAVLQISTVWVYASLPVGMFLTVARLIQSMVTSFLHRHDPKKEGEIAL